MFISCGNGYGIYMTSEEYFSLTDEEYADILRSECFQYYDPYYYSSVRHRNRFLDRELFPQDSVDDGVRELGLNEILNILESSESNIFLAFEDNIDMSDEEL